MPVWWSIRSYEIDREQLRKIQINFPYLGNPVMLNKSISERDQIGDNGSKKILESRITNIHSLSLSTLIQMKTTIK